MNQNLFEKYFYLFIGITVCTALLSAFDDAIMLWCCTFFYGLSLRSEIFKRAFRVNFRILILSYSVIKNLGL